MAIINRTREGSRNQKKSEHFFSAELTPSDFVNLSDTIELAAIPKDAVIQYAKIVVKEAFNPGTSMAIIGELGGVSLFTSVSLGTIGVKAVTLTVSDSDDGNLLTIISTIVGAMPTVGRAELMVEYIEYEKHMGEYTEYSTTP